MDLTVQRSFGLIETEDGSYPSDLSDEKWAFCAPYLTLMREDAPQLEHSLRAVFNALRWLVRTGKTAQPSAAIIDSRTLQSTPSSRLAPFRWTAPRLTSTSETHAIEPSHLYRRVPAAGRRPAAQ